MDDASAASGVIRATRAVLPHMRAQGSGTIVTVGSIAGKVAAPYGGIYSASKHAVEALSDALYYELHPFGIRVVLVEPGSFETEIANNSQSARRFTEGSAYIELERRFAEASVKLPGAGEGLSCNALWRRGQGEPRALVRIGGFRVTRCRLVGPPPVRAATRT